ncbi:iron uptake system protein EfeO [Paenibacillus sp. NEAU-GSW1]|uniref:iron uptake system protein EfeO n=1 Tax=Paenibacillus sp. NEAU-GSW1 TaxID=2682486 RepID=UPI0012E1A8BD|nr:iron uptake system protein EfeO [Paenibacillus sp. NEAU-GSW1]MUT68437.1 EfeM/EfeO family lipoprotein [Paenibacillus sp. NEAU-GSW1]
MKLKLTALVLASALVFTGCGSNNTDNKAADAQPAASADNSGNSAAKVEDWDAITEQYRQFAIEQADSFVIETEKFVTAVKTGDVEGAKKLYAPTRMYFERIEPIAEALGDFDPNIDARENDVEEKDWRGFHRIEQALWEKNTTDGMEGYADTLLQDVKLLRALMETVEVEPSLLVTGAVELLNEVSSSKVTGEEERYSHTDLYDFAANVEGAKKIYELLQPELKKHNAELEGEIGKSFSSLEDALGSYKNADGYVSYLELKEEDTKKLSQLLDALAEPLSQMGTILGA